MSSATALRHLALSQVTSSAHGSSFASPGVSLEAGNQRKSPVSWSPPPVRRDVKALLAVLPLSHIVTSRSPPSSSERAIVSATSPSGKRKRLTSGGSTGYSLTVSRYSPE